MTTDIKAVGVIGAGLVGSGWVIVFARAGYRVRVYDPSPEVRAGLPDKLLTTLSALSTHRLISDVEDVLGRVEVVETLGEGLEGVTYVQESVPERADVKRAIYEEIDVCIHSNVAVGSSSSGIPGSVFYGRLAPRCQLPDCASGQSALSCTGRRARTNAVDQRGDPGARP